MRKIKDRIILGLVIGFIGNISKIVTNELLYRKGIEKKRFGDIVAGIFLPTKQAASKKGTLFGVAGDFAVSAFLGVPLVYLLSFTGKDKAWVKGWLTGAFGFGLFRGVMATFGIGKTYPKDPITNSLMTMNSSFWGITAGLLAPLIGDERLFRPTPSTLSNPNKFQTEKPSEKHFNKPDQTVRFERRYKRHS